MKKIFLLLISATILFTSCLEDTGNYDYTQLPDFEISGVQEKYSVTSFIENLTITPQIISSNTNFEYAWFITNEYLDAYNNLRQVGDTISREKVLDIPFEYKSGSYELTLKVTDVYTGVAKYAQTTIEATTPFSRGFYILKETSSGDTEMDIHYPDGTSNLDAITEFTGTPLKGKPQTLSYITEFSMLEQSTGEDVVEYLVIPKSEQESKTLSLTDMRVVREEKDWFYGAYDFKKVSHIACIGYAFIMITEDGYHDNYQSVRDYMTSSGIFSNIPAMSYYGENMKPSSNTCYFGVGNSHAPEAYFYDAESGGFASIDYNAGSVISYLEYQEAQESVEGDVLQLVGVSPAYADAYMYIICQKEDGNRYCYYTAPSQMAIEINKKIEFSNIAEFNNADFYAGCREGGSYLYAVKNNRIYALNPATGQSKELTFASLPQGEITYFDTMYSENEFNYFVIGTYNNGEYTLSCYDMIGGEPVVGEEPLEQYLGSGAIKTIQYATPDKTSGGGLYYNASIHY